MASDEAASIRLEDPERPGDRDGVRAVEIAAFGRTDEADLVDALRGDANALLSLVAELGGRIVGHVLFGRIWIKTADGLASAVSLAPVAVLPENQSQGIGTLLIQRGLELIKERGERIVIVAGHPAYYPRFGFSAEKARLLESPFPPEAFMALELCPGALNGVQGPVIYPPIFGI